MTAGTMTNNAPPQIVIHITYSFTHVGNPIKEYLPQSFPFDVRPSPPHSPQATGPFRVMKVFAFEQIKKEFEELSLCL